MAKMNTEQTRLLMENFKDYLSPLFSIKDIGIRQSDLPIPTKLTQEQRKGQFSYEHITFPIGNRQSGTFYMVYPDVNGKWTYNGIKEQVELDEGRIIFVENEDVAKQSVLKLKQKYSNARIG